MFLIFCAALFLPESVYIDNHMPDKALPLIAKMDTAIHRLEHVAHLLKTTDEPVALIGELSGIPSRATLARLFRNTYGMSCSGYRQVDKHK